MTLVSANTFRMEYRPPMPEVSASPPRTLPAFRDHLPPGPDIGRTSSRKVIGLTRRVSLAFLPRALSRHPFRSQPVSGTRVRAQRVPMGRAEAPRVAGAAALAPNAPSRPLGCALPIRGYVRNGGGSVPRVICVAACEAARKRAACSAFQPHSTGGRVRYTAYCVPA